MLHLSNKKYNPRSESIRHDKRLNEPSRLRGIAPEQVKDS
jgi:hypothetical protein